MWDIGAEDDGTVDGADGRTEDADDNGSDDETDERTEDDDCILDAGASRWFQVCVRSVKYFAGAVADLLFMLLPRCVLRSMCVCWLCEYCKDLVTEVL